jgi:hypothetical protein
MRILLCLVITKYINCSHVPDFKQPEAHDISATSLAVYLYDKYKIAAPSNKTKKNKNKRAMRIECRNKGLLATHGAKGKQ